MTQLIPDEVLEVLQRVKEFAPSAILAGGYLRDTVLDRPAKDIDIFCCAEVEPMRLRRKFPEARLEPFSHWLEYQDNEVVSVWNLGTAMGLPVQLIEIDGHPLDRAKEHDFGICQVWHDGTDMDSTEAFLRDCLDSSFTLVRCENQAQFDRSMKRFARLSQKYPDHELVIPLEFKQWMKP